MTNSINIGDVQKLVSKDEFRIAPVANILFLDVSSTCTGYAIAEVNFQNKTANITKTGALWFDPKWDHQEKYSYIFNIVLTYFEVVEKIDYIVHEAYSVNINKRQGLQVLPEMLGAIKVAAAENGIKVGDFPPQSWRSQLKIKPDIKGKDSKGKSVKDYKTPTKRKILDYMDVPERSVSNITGNERATPSDVYDALGLGIGWLSKVGFRTIKADDCEFNTHIGSLQ